MVRNLKGRCGNFNTGGEGGGEKSMERPLDNPYFSHAGSAFPAPATQLRFTARVGKQISRCALAPWTTSDEANRRRRFICTSARPRSSGSHQPPLLWLLHFLDSILFRPAGLRAAEMFVVVDIRCHGKHAFTVALSNSSK